MGLLSFTKPDPSHEKTKCRCEQPDYEVRGGDELHIVHCNLCGGERNLYHLFNNLIERVKRLEAVSISGNTCNDASWKPNENI